MIGDKDFRDVPIIIDFQLDLDSLQLVYNSIEVHLKYWEGSPRRPAEEQEELFLLKAFLYKALMSAKYEAGII